jgi:hypothetical protein
MTEREDAQNDKQPKHCPCKIKKFFDIFGLHVLMLYFCGIIFNESKEMETLANNPPLNAMQIHFLQSLRFVNTDEMYRDLKQIISDYYFNRIQERTDKWWEDKSMTNEKLDEMFKNSHYRISAK